MSKIRKPVNYKCPSCGHPIPVGSPACPRCNRIFTQEELGNYTLEIEKARMEDHKDRMFAKWGLIIIAALFIYLSISSMITDRRINSEDRKMEVIYTEIQTAIGNEDYDEAFYKLLLLKPKSNLSSDLTEKWEDVQNELTKFIEEKQKQK